MGRTEGDLKAGPGERQSLAELVSYSAAISQAEIELTRGFRAEKVSTASLYGSWWRKSPKSSSVKRWGMGQERGTVGTADVDGRRGRCAVCASVGGIWRSTAAVSTDLRGIPPLLRRLSTDNRGRLHGLRWTFHGIP